MVKMTLSEGHIILEMKITEINIWNIELKQFHFTNTEDKIYNIGNIRKYCQCFSVNITENTSKYWGCQGFCQDSLAQNQQILSKNAENIGPNVQNTGFRQAKKSKYWECCQKYWPKNPLNIRNCQGKNSKYWESCQKYWSKNAVNTRKY